MTQACEIQVNKCRRCGLQRTGRAGGQRTYCKPCRKRYMDANREKIRAQVRAQQVRYRAEHPDRARARAAASHAFKRKRLLRQACSKCGTPGAQAHHPDYSRPLLVEWLCIQCHHDHHREAREAAQSVQPAPADDNRWRCIREPVTALSERAKRLEAEKEARRA